MLGTEPVCEAAGKNHVRTAPYLSAARSPLKPRGPARSRPDEAEHLIAE